MTNYRSLALIDLSAQGLSPEGLIRCFPLELKRFRLACDMGETGIQLPSASPGEDALMSVAIAWQELAATWPPQKTIAGIELPILESAFCFSFNDAGLKLSDIPIALHTEAIRIASVSRDGYSLTFMPADCQNEEIWLAAVTDYGYALEFIPPEKQSEAVRLAAVTQEGRALKFIPIEQQSEATRRAALTHRKDAAKYMPKDIAAQILLQLRQESNEPSP